MTSFLKILTQQILDSKDSCWLLFLSFPGYFCFGLTEVRVFLLGFMCWRLHLPWGNVDGGGALIRRVQWKVTKGEVIPLGSLN